MMVEPFHTPVMISEVLRFLKVECCKLYVDCTLGGGGHSQAILKEGGRVISIDRDPEAVAYAQARLIKYRERFEAHVARFSDIDKIAGENAGSIYGILMDLGVSSRMIDDSSRGFSYISDGPLLMNMGVNDKVTAFDVVNTKSELELSDIFKKFGEERKSKRIAGSIVKFRSSHPIKTTRQLADIVEKSVGGRMPQKSKARIFQAKSFAV